MPRVKPSEYHERLLVRFYEKRYKNLGVPTWAEDYLSEELAELAGQPLEQDRRPLESVTDSTLRLMENRGWIERKAEVDHLTGETVGDAVTLTPAGIDYARWLCRPWYLKMWDFLKAPMRTVILAAITALVVTVATNLLMRALGWN